MSADQKIGWRYYIDAAPAGMLKLCDLPALATLVIAADLQRQASLKLQEGIGLLVKAGNGTPVPSPYVTIVARQSDIMLRASAELGFTPTSRGRVVMGEPPLPRDEFFD
ncbi:P27 family phage terminase small subunit [Sphingosinicellaceae bacterium]|nr:P27 family phage terminase small subunit [Sphingosinicellaceae bacterium]